MSISLHTWINQYGDLQIAPEAVAALRGSDDAAAAFAQVVSTSKRGVWLSVDWDTQADLLPVAARLGFKPHHTYGGKYVTLHAWTLSIPNPTPPYAHMGIGVGAIVVNSAGAVLGIREAFDRSGKLNVPGGHMDEGEDWVQGAVREAEEETGVKAVPLGICCIRQVHLADQLPLGAEEATAESRPSERSLQLREQARRAGVAAGTPTEAVPAGGAAAHSSDASGATAAASTATVPSPASAWPYAGARGSWEHRTRWGTGHLGVHTLAYAPDSTLSPDPNEVSEAVWVSPAEFIARAHPHMAMMVQAAVESGQVEAAAALAREHAACGAAPPDAAARVPMLLMSTSVVQRAPPPPVAGSAGGPASSMPPSPQSTTSSSSSGTPIPPLDFPLTLYHCYPRDTLVKAAVVVQQAQEGKPGAGPVRLE